LSNLIWLGFRAFALKVDALHHTRLRENVMAAGNTHPKSFHLQQMTKFFEPNVRVRISAQNFIESFFGTHGLSGNVQPKAECRIMNEESNLFRAGKSWLEELTNVSGAFPKTNLPRCWRRPILFVCEEAGQFT
jgi:hypothetical protein